MNRNRVYVSEQKIIDLLEKVNMSKKDFSESIGRADGFIHHFIGKNRQTTMCQSDYMLIKSMYGADIMEDKPIEQKADKMPLSEVRQKSITDLTGDDLSRLIYQAVYSAIMHSKGSD